MAEGAIVVTDQNQPISVVSTGAKTSQVVTAGTRGPRGPQGEKGDEGLSAYGVWLADGNTGTLEDFFAFLSGGDYTHDQMTPAFVWTIQHDLAFFPNVTVMESAGKQIFGDVEYIDQNNLTITFSREVAGKAYLS